MLLHKSEGDYRAKAFKFGNRVDPSFTNPLAALGTEVQQGFDGEAASSPYKHIEPLVHTADPQIFCVPQLEKLQPSNSADQCGDARLVYVCEQPSVMAAFAVPLFE